MTVLGTVTDDMKSVIFVEISAINVGKKEYLALKDGKILPPRPSPGAARAPDGKEGHGQQVLRGEGEDVRRRRHGASRRSYSTTRTPTPSGYWGSRSEWSTPSAASAARRWTGTTERHILVCSVCGNAERRKVSVLYGQPEKIKALFA